MLDRSQVDVLLTDKFFVKPVRNTLDDIHLNFPLPSSIQTLPAFISGLAWPRFINGVKRILNKLSMWALDNNIDPLNLETFYEMHFSSVDTKDPIAINYRLSSFGLYAEGVPLLAKINELIEKNGTTLSYRKMIMQQLIHDIVVCPDGAHKNCFNACIALTNDPSINLMSIKQSLAEQQMIKLIGEYNNEVATYALKIAEEDQANRYYQSQKILEGDEIHYVNTLLNVFADQIGIEVNNDSLQKDKSSIATFIQPLAQTLAKTYQLDAIIEQMILNLDIQSILEKMRKNPAKYNDYYDELAASIASLGEDAQFDINDLFDAEALLSGDYQLAKNADYYLWTTLLRRLANGGYVDLAKAEQHKRLDKNIFLFPGRSLKLAFVQEQQKITPFIPYCAEQVQQGNLDLFSLINDQRQRAEMNHLIETQINTWLQQATNVQAMTDAQKELFFLHYLQKNVDENAKWLQSIWHLLANEDRMLLASYMLTGITSGNTAVNFSISVSGFFKDHLQKNISDIIDAERLEASIKNADHLLMVLCLMDTPRILGFLCNLRNQGLRNLVFSEMAPYRILACLSPVDKIAFLTMIHTNANFQALCSSPQSIGQTLAMILPSQYNLFINGLCGKDKLQKTVTSFDHLTLMLMWLEKADRIMALSVLDSDFLHAILLTARHIGGMLTMILDEHQAMFLNKLGLPFIQSKMHSISDLLDITCNVKDIYRGEFISQLGRDCIETLIANRNDFKLLLSHVDVSGYGHYLKTFSPDYYRRVMPTTAHLLDVLDNMKPGNRYMLLSQLDSSVLHSYINQLSAYAAVLARLEPVDYPAYLKLTSSHDLNAAERFIPTSAELQSILFVLREDVAKQNAFLSAFADSISAHELAFYKSNPSIYEKLYSLKHPGGYFPDFATIKNGANRVWGFFSGSQQTTSTAQAIQGQVFTVRR